jgi:hypothetical protein
MNQRLEDARRAAGQAGIEALRPQRRVDPLLARFFATQVQEWLDLELGPGLQVELRGQRPTVLEKGVALYQLRLVPDLCRWLLLRPRRGRWWPHVPDRPCLALVDWLRQIRRHRTGHYRGG